MVLAVAISVAPITVARADPTPIPVDSESITSPVGLAADTKRNLYWTSNGDDATVYAINQEGKVTRTVKWQSSVKSVEALSMYRGELYVGDIGDENKNRSFITVYCPSSLENGASGTYRAWDLRYPNGEKHHAETMMISGKGNIYIVTKGENAGIYRAPNPLSSLSRSKKNTMVRVSDAPDWVTDGTFNQESNKIVLRTYTSIYVIDAYNFKILASDVLPIQEEGEAITTNLDGQGLVIMDQRPGSPLLLIEMPTKRLKVDTAPSTAPGAGAPQPTAGAEQTSGGAEVSEEPTKTKHKITDSDDDQGSVRKIDSKAKNTGTKVAIGLAVAVALIAAVVVALNPQHDSRRH